MKTFFHPFISFSFLFLFFTNSTEAQTSGYSGTGANIDVVYHRAQWTINPDVAKFISGTVTTYFKTTQASVNKITFDLNSAHSFSATYSYNGTTLTTSRPSANVIEITLPFTLPVNSVDSVTISYSGAPPPFSNFGEGYERNNVTSTTPGPVGNVIYTLAESYGDED